MKNLMQKLLPVLLVFGFILACNDPLLEEEFSSDEMELKSAQSNKTSYIVLLDDPEANQELPFVKGYEQRNEVMQKVSARILKRAGILDGEVEFVYTTALQGFSVKIPPGQLKKLENDPSVIKISEDQIVTLIEPHAKPGEDIQATAAQVTPWGIARVKGGQNYSGTNVAWIIDTGIDLDHPDLNVYGSGGASFVPRVTSPNDDNGHGSHVAGTIAAKNNSEGVIGVAAGATVIPVKVLDRRGSGAMSGVLAGVDFVATKGKSGDVANMSLGGSYYEDLNTAVQNAAAKGILFSLAAGNESTNAGTKSPASANGVNIFTISAMDSYDNFASFSNYGNPPVDYCEPGVSIYSTYKDGGYATASGTSMAAPHMAGILLLKGKVFPTDGTVKGDPDGNPDPIAVVQLEGTQNTPPTANFTFTANDLTVNFTDTSTDSDGFVDGWSWNFGDGGTSTAQNPSHTYALGGTYNVSLTVTDDDGATGTTSKSVTVSGSTTNQPPSAGFTFTTNNLTATFTDTSTDSDGSVVSWSWTFGDGGTSTAQNPSHTYSAGGTYTVSLTVKDDDGATGSTSKSVTVSSSTTNTPPAIDNFSLTNTSNPAWKRVSVSWSVSDADGDLKSVVIALKDPGGIEVATSTTAVSGSSASGTNELGKKGGTSGTYTVIITVTDAAGKTGERSDTIVL